MATQSALALYLKAFADAQDTIDELQRELQLLEDEHDVFLRNLLAGLGTSSAATKVLDKTVVLNGALSAAKKAKDNLRDAIAKFVHGAQPPAAGAAALGVDLANIVAGQEALSLEVFQENYRKARDLFQDEFNRQQDLSQDAATEAERLAAADAANELQAKLKELRDEKDAFLTNAALRGNAAIGPRDDVVRATIKLNKDLAKVIVDANRPKTMLGIVTSFLGGAIHVFNGSVPPTPAPGG